MRHVKSSEIAGFALRRGHMPTMPCNGPVERFLRLYLCFHVRKGRLDAA
jgi:hypothetical protein